MPFVTNRGQQIHYTVEGEGPLVVFQHGLLSSARSWKEYGFVGALKEKYRVACVDSLGHGLSDKPSDPKLYGQRQRSEDIVAVIDDLKYDHANLVGYSMGGWMSVGVAKYHPKRLSSLVVGGWNVVTGKEAIRPPGSDGPLSFDSLLKAAGAVAPELVAWVTPDVVPGLRACWDALEQLEGAPDAVLTAGVPVLLWNGRDDPYHDPMKAFAADNKLPFLSTGGNHIEAVVVYGAESAQGIRAFLEG